MKRRRKRRGETVREGGEGERKRKGIKIDEVKCIKFVWTKNPNPPKWIEGKWINNYVFFK